MSITFPAAYSAKLHSSSLDVDWLFHFKNNNAGYVYLASKDRTVGGNRYYGVVEESGEITREIDLLNCVASVGELSISCADVFKTGTLSGELLHNGSDYYINQEVKIYECANSESTLANCPLLYEGRLKEIDIQGNGVVLVIEQWTPFDHIKLPQAHTNTHHVFVPIVYGDYSGNSADTDNFCTGVNLYPAPFIRSTGQGVYYVPCKTTDCNPHYYDNTQKMFIPINNVTTEQSVEGVNAFYFTDELSLTYSVRPTAGESVAEFTNDEKIYDADKSTYAERVDTTASTTVDIDAQSFYDSNRVITDLRLRTKAEVEIVSLNSPPGFQGTVTWTVDADGFGPTTILSRNDAPEGVGTSATSGEGTDSEYDDYDITGNVNPVVSGSSAITFGSEVNITLDDVSAKWRLYDIYLKITSEYNKDETTGESKNAIDQVKVVYVDTDGTVPTYTDVGGDLGYEPQQIHRDLMNLFGGIDYDNDYMENWIAASPGDFDLDAARDGWKCRFWQLEPGSLKEMLEKLQFEGCFIFMFVADADGSGNAGGRYIWVQNTYAAGNVVQTFNEDDYTNLSIGHTDVYEIITKTVYDFDRSPVDDSYRQEDEYDNTTDRDHWNLGTSHEERIKLDYLVGSKNATDAIYDGGTDDDTPNESICLYRDNLQSEPKILVDCEMTNKKKSNVDVGDIIKFNDSNVLPYGDAWADLYFMVISERRTKTGLSITAKEVYRT